MVSTKITTALFIAMLSFGVCWSYEYNEPAEGEKQEYAEPEGEEQEVIANEELEEQSTNQPQIQEMVELDAEAQYVDPHTIRLRLNRGQSDYASCAGTYKKMKFATIRGKPIYLNARAHRFMFFTGGNWVITANQYIFVIMQGGTGGFYGSRHTYGPANAYTRDGSCRRRVSIWANRYSHY